MTDWNAAQYVKFEAERTQPCTDLINRLSDISPARILDLGCGPGNSTAALAKHFGNSSVLGIDASENMLEKAKITHPELEFKKCFVPNELESLGRFDLIFSNACIHWIPEQKNLLKSIFNSLADGGTLAVQIPYIQKAPFYRMLNALIAESGRKELAEIKNFHNLLPEEYYDLLAEISKDFSIWETTYYHTVSSREGITEWYKGSGLRPYLDVLKNEPERKQFLEELHNTVKKNYPIQPNGSVILKMPRLFFTAKK